MVPELGNATVVSASVNVASEALGAGLVPLDCTMDETRYGGKAAALAKALAGGLLVPPGFALDTDLVEAYLAGAFREPVAEAFRSLGGPIAVRSSVLGEDSPRASFAGQHVSRLNITSEGQLPPAIRAVWESGRAEAALAYRGRAFGSSGIAAPGAEADARVGVVLQRLVPADVAGVLFTRDPLTHRDERVVEASWGLGEAVVSGHVIPDLYRISREGRLLNARPGHKNLVVEPVEPSFGGGTREVRLSGASVEAPCLDATHISRLTTLADHCERVFGRSGQDIEWAFAGTQVFLLQRRPMTWTFA